VAPAPTPTAASSTPTHNLNDIRNKVNGADDVEQGHNQDECDEPVVSHVRVPPFLLIRSILQDDPLYPQIYVSRGEEGVEADVRITKVQELPLPETLPHHESDADRRILILRGAGGGNQGSMQSDGTRNV
jgi:hypothetical protein